MATYWSGQRPVVDPDLGMLAPQVSGLDSLDPWLEQALDPYRVSGGLELGPYMQGVNILPGGLGNMRTIENNRQAANTILSRLYASDPSLFRGGAFTPWTSWDEFNARQNTREGFNEGSGLGDFLSGSIEHLGDTVSELWAEPGVRALLAAGTAGAFMGPGAATTGAATGGTAAGTDLAFGAAGGDLTLGSTAALTDAELLSMAGITPTYSGAAAPFTLTGSEAAFPWLSNAPAGSVFSAANAVPAASFLGSVGLPELASSGMGDVISETGGSGFPSFLPSLGNIFGSVGKLLPSADTAAALAPILAAISYAKSQGPFDTSRLTSTYDQFQPEALAFEYDQNTARGRDALTSSLTNRGVMGSSFGNMDITNFQTSRDLGRRSLVNQGLAARGGIANSIIDAEAKERALKNQLYGTSLLALGNVFGGRNQQTQQPQQQSSKSIFDRLFG